MRPELRAAVLRRWPDAATFYSERDDRTVRLVGDLPRYAGIPVQIVLDPGIASTATGQRLLLISSNLMARWARRVQIVAPDTSLAPSLKRGGHIHLRERVLAEMELADPFGRFEWVELDSVGEAGSDTFRLFLGPWNRSRIIGPAGDDYLVHASGWTVFGRRGEGVHGAIAESASIPSVALAASLGVADIFKRAMGHSRREWLPSFAWSTWSHGFVIEPGEALPWIDPEVSDVIPLGRTLIAGVGAIGSAIIYFADLGILRGELGVLDRDRVETSNLNRSPLFTVEHVLGDEFKVRLVEDYLRANGFKAVVHEGTWAELVADVKASDYDLWISLTNEEGAWAGVPFQLPPVVIHGTTTSGWGFGAGRHVPGVDDCTYCRMPRPEAEFRALCSVGEIAPDDRPATRAALPFLSAASAALVLAEVWKVREKDRQSLPNDVSADLQAGLPAVVALTRRSTEECPGCRAAGLCR